MRKAAASSGSFHNATSAASLTQLDALREAIRTQRDRAIALWHACVPGPQTAEEREPLGSFTEKLLKGRADAPA